MRNKPRDLAEASLVEPLHAGWGLTCTVSAMEYLPVGFGSHHWRVIDSGDRQWFLTVDDLPSRRCWDGESVDSVYERLRATLLTARAIADAGVEFVLAPIRGTDGEILTRVGPNYSAALYPYVEGKLRHFDEVPDPAERARVIAVLATLHTVPTTAAPASLIEDFEIDNRASLIDALGTLDTPWTAGPYAEPTRLLLRDHTAEVERLFIDYDQLAALGRARPDRMVVTHGEPHPGNFIETASGWFLVDWDTARVAPPERDLWFLDAPDDPEHSAYTAITGTDVQASMLELYRLAWRLTEITQYVGMFRRPHDDDDNARESMTNLTEALQF